MKRIHPWPHSLNNKNCRSLFLLNIVILVIFLMLFLPLVNYGLELAIHLWGQSYITPENLLSFLSNPPTLILFSAIGILISYFIFFQMITLIRYNSNFREDEKPNIFLLIPACLREVKKCMALRGIIYPVFTVFPYLFMNMPILIVILLQTRIVYYSHASDLYYIKFLLLAGLLLISFIALRSIFFIHFYLDDHNDFLSSLEQSKQLLRGHYCRTFGILLKYNLILVLFCYFVYYVVMFFAAFFICLAVDKAMVITEFLKVYPTLHAILLIFSQMAVYLTNLKLITTLYQRYRGKFSATLRDPVSNELIHPTTRKKHKRFENSFLLIVIIIAILNSVLAIRSDSFRLREELSGIQISSHRGNSHVAPENTLPALENAIIANSDYAEVDVRQTKDGGLILLHDESLLRTAGLNKNISDITRNELENLDAGSWFSHEFVKTRVPTLEDALLLCKGKIKLNIEIKGGNKKQHLEENLVAMINQYDFEHQCLISCTDYNTLKKIKALDASIRTGLIISAAYGNIYSKKAVDFFSIDSRYVTRQAVEKAHLAGKEVHVWTVNRASEIERMKSLGVDCIITDNPTLTREVLYQDNTSKTFIELLNRMMKSRFLYRFF